jgi:serine/threonine protein kinase
MADANWVREYQDGDVVPGTGYRVVRLMGAGGMGSVYEVEHVEIGRHYVLKQLLRTLASRGDLILRMQKEWKALGVLRHPNIVDVVYAGNTADGIPYYVMELLVGETVRERLEREGKLSAGHAAGIAQQTLLGLSAAHAIGVVHRDIKPANIFLTRDGAVKVLDFGISYSESVRKITAKGLAIGTPRYMSPEQASGEKADARSDLYAVGLLLYEMLAGEGPFDDLSEVTQQMLAHLHRPPRPLSRFVEVPAALDAVLARALAKNPQERPRSAEYMAAELTPFATALRAESRPIATPPQSVPSPVQLSTPWQHPTREVRSTRSARSPIPATPTPRPFLTKGTAIGAAAIAVFTASAVFLGFARSEAPIPTVTATVTTTSTATSTAPPLAPRPSSNRRTEEPVEALLAEPLLNAGAADLGAPAGSASVTPIPPPPRAASSARKPAGRLDSPQAETIRLPPSGL